MEWGKIAGSLLVGAILGIGGTLYLFNARLARIEALVEAKQSHALEQGTVGASLPLISQAGKGRHDAGGRVLFRETFNGNVFGWPMSADNIPGATRTVEGGHLLLSRSGAQNSYLCLSFHCQFSPPM